MRVFGALLMLASTADSAGDSAPVWFGVGLFLMAPEFAVALWNAIAAPAEALMNRRGARGGPVTDDAGDGATPSAQATQTPRTAPARADYDRAMHWLGAVVLTHARTAAEKSRTNAAADLRKHVAETPAGHDVHAVLREYALDGSTTKAQRAVATELLAVLSPERPIQSGQ